MAPEPKTAKGEPAAPGSSSRAEESVQAFRLGVAAPEWNDLERRLVAKGVAGASLAKAGLLVEGDRGPYDRFRGRLMFPIASMDGQVVGFGGRALGEEKGAKYLNTPETPLYKKSKVLSPAIKQFLAILKEEGAK